MNNFDPTAYWEGRLQKHTGLAGVGYLGLGKPYNDWLYRVRRRVFRRILRSIDLDLSQAEVLDIGCGTGFYIERWNECGVRRASGVDLTQVAVERLRARFPGSVFYQLDISGESLPAGLGQYDLISAFDVLFHITDDQRYAQALRNIAALLRPGGWFVFSENFLHGDTVRTPHVVSRSRVEIETLLDRAGLKMIRRGPMFVLMNYPVDTRSSLPRSLWNTLVLPVRVHRGIGMVTGFLLGALLYPLEVGLTAGKTEGPSTEYAICRKIRD